MAYEMFYDVRQSRKNNAIHTALRAQALAKERARKQKIFARRDW
jgi:hypothetical protein